MIHRFTHQEVISISWSPCPMDATNIKQSRTAWKVSASYKNFALCKSEMQTEYKSWFYPSPLKKKKQHTQHRLSNKTWQPWSYGTEDLKLARLTKPDLAINLTSCVASSLAKRLEELWAVSVLPVRCLCCFGRNLQRRSCSQKTFLLRLQLPKLPWALWPSGQSHSLLWVQRWSLKNVRHGATGSGS